MVCGKGLYFDEKPKNCDKCPANTYQPLDVNIGGLDGCLPCGMEGLTSTEGSSQCGESLVFYRRF